MGKKLPMMKMHKIQSLKIEVRQFVLEIPCTF